MRMKSIKSLLFLVIFTLPLSLQAETLSIIANKSLELDQIDKKLLRRIYLGKASHKVNGLKLEPLDENYSSNVYLEFLENVLFKSQAEIDSYWSRRIFNGQGFPPREIKGDTSVIDMVAENKKYLGYIKGEPTSDKVKVILTIEY